jgi:uncharacterized membrane protein YccF (DUF307 family)
LIVVITGSREQFSLCAVRGNPVHGTVLICINVSGGVFWFPSRHRQIEIKPMSPVSLLLNVLWIVLGGAWMAVGWLIAAVVMAITIVGIPWARAAFNIAAYTLFPFGSRAVSRAAYTGQEDVGTGPLGVIGNIVWLVLAGWWLALAHLVTAIVLAVTIVGIPFAWAHLKLAGIALWPIGKVIVPA